jgi:8-oxo-dGTP pyrophosphatase MutT (NUDIX family)
MAAISQPQSGVVQVGVVTERIDHLASKLIITNGQGEFFLQQRDNDPKILFPGFFGLFGGEAMPGEHQDAALIREVAEEIGVTLTKANFTYVTDLIVYFEKYKLGRVRAYYYHSEFSAAEIASIQVNEGQGSGWFTRIEIVQMANRITAVDYLALTYFFS